MECVRNVLVDVRNQEKAFAVTCLIKITAPALAGQSEELTCNCGNTFPAPRDRKPYVVCRKCGRSERVARMLSDYEGRCHANE